MRYASIKNFDITNGIGIGVSLFVQGCTHHCKNCFNPNTWSFNGGKEWTEEIEQKFFELCSKDEIDHISILGGEPLDQDYIGELLQKLQQFKKPIYLWTGYIWEKLSNDMKQILLNNVTYLIDGEYIDELKDYKLFLRGSSNQRIIDLKNNKILDRKDF